MELTEIQIYIGLIVGTGATVAFGISGIKFLYHRYTTGLDSRISGCIQEKIAVFQQKQTEHETRIKSLEDRFDDFWNYLTGYRK